MKGDEERPPSPPLGVAPPRGVLGVERQGDGEGEGLSHSECPRLRGVSSQSHADLPAAHERKVSKANLVCLLFLQ